MGVCPNGATRGGAAPKRGWRGSDRHAAARPVRVAAGECVKRIAAGLALAALAAAGCGGDDDEPATTEVRTVTETEIAPADTTAPSRPAAPPGDEQEVQDVWRRYTTALGRADGEAVCSLLTENGEEEVLKGGASGDTCEEKVEAIGEFYEGFETELTDIRVQGDAAEAVSPARGQIPKQGLSFLRVDGEWRIDRSVDIQ